MLITFNHLPIESNIVTIKHIYQSYFQNILFCGLKMTQFLKHMQDAYKKFDSYTFIELDTDRGFYHSLLHG